MRPQKRIETIGITIPAGYAQQQMLFGDIPQLRSDLTKDIIIRSIQTFSVDSVSQDFKGIAAPTLAQLAGTSLTLYIEGEQSINGVPLLKLHNMYTGAVTAGFIWTAEQNEFENLMVDWTKSFLTFQPGILPIATQVDFVFAIGYQRLKPGTMNKLRQAAGQSNCADPSGMISMM